MNLAELQSAVVQMRAARGFTTDPARILVLIVEELGEVARELKGAWSPNYDDPSVDRISAELADTAVLLLALASAYGVDLSTAIDRKFFEQDDARDWPSANG